MNRLNNLPFGWFDLVLVAMLVVGFLRGRKRGMSQEFLDVIKWLVVVLVAGFYYEPVGRMLAQNRVFSLLFSCLVAYLGIMLVVLAVFTYVKRVIGGKLLGSDKFGGAEYPLGMVSGIIRFACMTLVMLALLNARNFDSHEVAAEIKFQNDNYGSQFFPTLRSVQSAVFEKSLTGPWIKRNLALLLIKPTAPEKKDLKDLRPKSDFP
jgi:uncharacterized membrane protein required for colicin V production